MKKVFKKNQIVIAVLAVMIADFFLCIKLLSPPWGLGGAGALPRRVRPAYSRTLCLPHRRVGTLPLRGISALNAPT